MGGFVHLELSTDNVKKAKSFYQKVFGWETTDVEMPGGSAYTMLQLTNPGGGMMKKPMAEAPTMWLPYIAVDDIKKTVKEAEKAGAGVIMASFQAEGFGEGAILSDPTGAAFGIWHSTNGAQAASSKKASKKKAPAAKKTSSKKIGKKKTASKKKKK